MGNMSMRDLGPSLMSLPGFPHTRHWVTRWPPQRCLLHLQSQARISGMDRPGVRVLSKPQWSVHTGYFSSLGALSF